MGVQVSVHGRASPVRLEPWSSSDLVLLQACLGDPVMMEHLGGPENPERIAERQARYELPDSGQFKIVHMASNDGVGWVGYWERDWQGRQVYEIGWAVIPAFQRKGVAVAATSQAIPLVSAQRRHQFLHAYPSTVNAPSNAICQRLGFTLLGPCDCEYPKGSLMRCNDWRLDLFASTGSS